MPAKLTTPLSSRFDEALQFASELHREQARKSTQIPYISHLLAVAALVLEHGGTETQAIAALLHDAVEDCGGDETLATVEEKFGHEVAAIVSACSDSSVVGEKPEWKVRKRSHLQHLRGVDSSALLVIAADKLHNLTTILYDLRAQGEEFWERFNAGPDQQMWYYKSVIEILDERLKNRIVERLQDTFSAVEDEVLRNELYIDGSRIRPLKGVQVFDAQIVDKVFGHGFAKRGFDFDQIWQFIEGNLGLTRRQAEGVGLDLASFGCFQTDETLAACLAKLYFAGVADGVEASRQQADKDSKSLKT